MLENAPNFDFTKFEKKLALKLNIEFERVILSMIFTNRGKLWNQF